MTITHVNQEVLTIAINGTLSAADRKIGGLGIFMTKKTVDEMSYEYRNETNILKLTKQIIL